MAYAGKAKILHDGTQRRQVAPRQAYDFNSSMVLWLQERNFISNPSHIPFIFNREEDAKDIYPQYATRHNPSTGVCTKYMAQLRNKNNTAIKHVRWSPEGRRVVTGCDNGEIALWNGFTFNFENTTQCHNSSITAMEWTRNGNFLITGDQTGILKYWEPAMNNIKEISLHDEAITSIALSPTDLVFATSSRDRTVAICNFETGQKIHSLAEHTDEVKQVSWHRLQSLLISGGRDSTLRIWDPRQGEAICNISTHASEITAVEWATNNYWWATTSRDGYCRIWDLRTLKPFYEWRAPHLANEAPLCLGWHPVHEQNISVGTNCGSIWHLNTRINNHVGIVSSAHTHPKSSEVWGLHWNPLGHVLLSVGNDHHARFWAQNIPGDAMSDKYNISQLPGDEMQAAIDHLAGIMSRVSQGADGTKEAASQANPAANNPAAESNVIPGLNLPEANPRFNVNNPNNNLQRNDQRNMNMNNNLAQNRIDNKNKFSNPSNPNKRFMDDRDFKPPNPNNVQNTNFNAPQPPQIPGGMHPNVMNNNVPQPPMIPGQMPPGQMPPQNQGGPPPGWNPNMGGPPPGWNPNMGGPPPNQNRGPPPGWNPNTSGPPPQNQGGPPPGWNPNMGGPPPQNQSGPPPGWNPNMGGPPPQNRGPPPGWNPSMGGPPPNMNGPPPGWNPSMGGPPPNMNGPPPGWNPNMNMNGPQQNGPPPGWNPGGGPPPPNQFR